MVVNMILRFLLEKKNVKGKGFMNIGFYNCWEVLKEKLLDNSMYVVVFMLKYNWSMDKINF